MVPFQRGAKRTRGSCEVSKFLTSDAVWRKPIVVLLQSPLTDLSRRRRKRTSGHAFYHPADYQHILIVLMMLLKS